MSEFTSGARSKKYMDFEVVDLFALIYCWTCVRLGFQKYWRRVRGIAGKIKVGSFMMKKSLMMSLLVTLFFGVSARAQVQESPIENPCRLEVFRMELGILSTEAKVIGDESKSLAYSRPLLADQLSKSSVSISSHLERLDILLEYCYKTDLLTYVQTKSLFKVISNSVDLKEKLENAAIVASVNKQGVPPSAEAFRQTAIRFLMAVDKANGNFAVESK